jgi:hypothetical protein
MGQCKAVADLTLGEVWRGDARAGFDAATSRILAYWTDECARDLGKLMTHFTSDAEVITPDGAYRGHEAVAALYQKSFDSYPGLGVDVTGGFPGHDAHCYEYRAVLTDAEHTGWLVEGINLMKLENGLIASLRSFEDALRRIPAAEGKSR